MFLNLRHLSRSLRRSPASASAAILTLSLALGAGVSIFAVVESVLLVPPPFADPAALVIAAEIPVTDAGGPPRSVPYGTFSAWRERAGNIATLEAYDSTNVTLTGVGAAERLSVTDVTPAFLTLLGISPVLGRAFESDDMGRPVVILSYAFWREKLGSDPNVIGRSIVLGARAHMIVGVLPEGFLFELNPTDVWRPVPLTSAQALRTGYPVNVVARLAPGVSPSSLATALEGVSGMASPPAGAVVTPIATAISGDASRTLSLLAGAAALAMLIAFTNFAGLLTVRSIDRRRELAIRNALGARPFETAKQLVLESQTLVALGIGGGVVLAFWFTPAVARLALQQFGGVARRDISLSWPVVGRVALAASLCACLCALAPALTAARRSVLDILRRGATPPPRERFLRRLLVAGEIALAFVLLVCVTLLGRSFVRLLEVNPGFDARGVLTLQVSLPSASYDLDRVASFYSTLHTALEQRLGPSTISFVNEIPLTGDRGRVRVGLTPSEVRLEAVVREAGSDYFNVMRIPVLTGRGFDTRDRASAPPRVVISEALAQRLFASETAIGRRIWMSGGLMAEIIGVAGDVPHRALDERLLPTLYLSALQARSRSNILVVRAERADADVITVVREEAGKIDPHIPMYRVRSMQDVVAASPGMPARRVVTGTFTLFAVLALLLGAMGLFGVVAHDVASRRAELAVRIALGADPTRILRTTLGQGSVMVVSGVAAGGVLSIWAARALSASGFAPPGIDAISIGVPAATLCIAGLAAILPAARRAARTDPLIVLRDE